MLGSAWTGLGFGQSNPNDLRMSLNHNIPRCPRLFNVETLQTENPPTWYCWWFQGLGRIRIAGIEASHLKTPPFVFELFQCTNPKNPPNCQHGGFGGSRNWELSEQRITVYSSFLGQKLCLSYLTPFEINQINTWMCDMNRALLVLLHARKVGMRTINLMPPRTKKTSHQVLLMH